MSVVETALCRTITPVIWCEIIPTVFMNEAPIIPILISVGISMMLQNS